MRYLYPFLFLVVLFSCLKEGPTKYDLAVVFEKRYKPDTRQTEYVPVYNPATKAYDYQTSTSGSYEKFTLIIQTKTGIIFESNSEEWYNRVREGDRLRVQYCELLDDKGNVRGHKLISFARMSSAPYNNHQYTFD